jgi:hypothetical protein
MADEIMLTDAQIEQIAERAADKAFERVYTQVGKSVLTKLAWFAGAAVIGIGMWLSGHGVLPKG